MYQLSNINYCAKTCTEDNVFTAKLPVGRYITIIHKFYYFGIIILIIYQQ